MLYLGCHLSASGGYAAMCRTARSIGANTFQFFTRNPRGGAAKAIVEVGGAKEVFACASHGVLSGPAIDRINDSVIDELLLLDTIPYPKDKPACDKIHYLPVAPVFAEAINRIYEEMSISSLFE